MWTSMLCLSEFAGLQREQVRVTAAVPVEVRLLDLKLIPTRRVPPFLNREIAVLHMRNQYSFALLSFGTSHTA